MPTPFLAGSESNEDISDLFESYTRSKVLVLTGEDLRLHSLVIFFLQLLYFPFLRNNNSIIVVPFQDTQIHPRAWGNKRIVG